jgi:cardiolipin synthase
MLEDCRSAQSYIYFEQFIWRDFGKDEIGARFLEVFRQKTKEGVRVKLIIDAVGSIGLSSNPWRQSEITNAGIELRFFGLVPRWRSLFPFSLFHRDHRKLLVVDDRVAHVGGVIISERAQSWEDIDVRITDHEYIKDIKGAFLRIWDETKGTKKHVSEYDDSNGIILKNDPENNDLYAELLQRVKGAQSKISIVTPYIAPDWRMLRALKKARKRGVDVEIILPEKGDSKLTGMVAASYMRQLRRYRIAVYHYRTCMNHGKMVLVDNWVTLGSMNFDRLSFFYNRELNVVFTKNLNQFRELISNLKSCSTRMGKNYFKGKGILFAFEALVGKLLRPIA